MTLTERILMQEKRDREAATFRPTVSQADIAAIAKGAAPVVRAYVEREISALEKRLKRVEEFLDEEAFAELLGKINARQSDRLIDECKKLIANELKAYGAMRYRGVWAEQVEYGVSDVVSHAGTLWAARADSTGLKPGSGNAAWVMILKSHG